MSFLATQIRQISAITDEQWGERLAAIRDSLPYSKYAHKKSKKAQKSLIICKRGIRVEGGYGMCDGDGSEVVYQTSNMIDYHLGEYMYSYFKIETHCLSAGSAGVQYALTLPPHKAIKELEKMVMASASLYCVHKYGEMTEDNLKKTVMDVFNTLIRKQADYGGGYNRHGTLGILSRLWDKISRYTTMTANNSDGHYEPLADSALDMTGYSIILMALTIREHCNSGVLGVVD